MAGESPFGFERLGVSPCGTDSCSYTEPFERPYPEVLAELTDQEATMLAVGMLLLLAMKQAAPSQSPEDRYNLTLAKLANEMYTRAMRRF